MSKPTLSRRSRFALLAILSAFLIALFGAPASADNTLPAFPGYSLGGPTLGAPTDTAPTVDTPAPADPSNYDYWNQIIEHRIPEVRDGAARYFPGGRYYVGPNGLEVRFNSTATDLLVTLTLAEGGYVVGAAAIKQIASQTTPMLVAAIQRMPNVVQIATGGAAGWELQQAIAGGKCLGLTLPSEWVANYLNGPIDNLVAFMNGNIPLLPGYRVPVWLEAC